MIEFSAILVLHCFFEDYMKKDIRFFILRHGRTVWNDQGLLQGWGNSPLTESGVAGAQAAGKVLENIPFIACYTSLLQRTVDTARHILGSRFQGENRVPIFQHQGLNEQFFGDWEGIQVDSIRETEEFRLLIKDPRNYQATQGGETWEELAERAMNAIFDIIKIHDNGDILVVSHGHTTRLLMALFAGLTWQEHRDKRKTEPQLNTAINIVRYVQEENESVGRFIIEKINDASHLDL